MDKRAFSKIPRPEANDEIIKLAERAGWPKFLVTAKHVEDGNKKILLLNFFRGEDLKKENLNAAFRTFLDTDDYITQDLTVASTKWKTGSLAYIAEWYGWHWYHKNEPKAIVAYDEDFEIIKHYVKNYTRESDSDVWEAIDRLQDKIKAARLEARYKRETSIIDQKMEDVKAIPSNFKNWAEETGLYFSRYLIYESGTKKVQINCFCTHCKSLYKIARKVVKPKNNQVGKCPECGSPGVYKAYGSLPSVIRDEAWLSLIQRTEKGFVMRYFRAIKTYHPKDYRVNHFSVTELVRIFYEGEKTKVYEWGEYKASGVTRWCPDKDKWNCADSVLYTENLPAEWKGTKYQYCSLNLLQDYYIGEQLPHWRLLRNYPDAPYMEYFIKLGLFSLAKGCSSGLGNRINDKGKSVTEILKIPKQYIEILRDLNGNSDILRILQVCYEHGILPTANQVKCFYESQGCKTPLIEMTKYASLQKIMNYIEKQYTSVKVPEEGYCWQAAYYIKSSKDRNSPNEKKDQLANDWLDYIRWCKELKYDLKNEFVLFPNNFYPVHDRTQKEYQDMLDEKKRKEKEAQERLIMNILKECSAIPALQMKAKGLVIKIPKDASELLREGQILHHCVGTYVERVAKKETMILFIRKQDSPDTPFFTLEWRDSKVMQCRGKNNCSMTKDVKAFVGAFEKKMKEYEQSLKKDVQKVG